MKIGVIMGGNSSEREVSLKTGKEMVNHLNKEKYEVVPIEITDGRDLLRHIGTIDFALLALHGKFGEDGTIQGLLEALGIPYSGCGVLSSSVCMDKAVAKTLLRANGVNTPDWIVVRKDEPLEADAVARLGFPLFVKPNSGGSSIGTKKVSTFDELRSAVEEIFTMDDAALAETYISGKEVTCSILNGKVLPILEIEAKAEFFDYESKYSANGADERVAALPAEIAERIEHYALKSYESLKCSVYARADMIVSDGLPYVLEMNTLPGFTQNSLFPKSALAAGYTLSELLDEIIALSMQARR